MTKIQQIIYAANSFSTGVLLPVLTLVLLERGADLQTLPLLLAIYSLTVLCMELPSGIFADMHGRKTAFLMSCGFLLISFTLFLVADNIIWLIAAIIFLGLGRAFSSGSLDALLIDHTLGIQGENCLPKATSRLAVLEGGGLATGGIVGGFITGLFGTYTSIIILRIALTIAVFILCVIFIKDQPSHNQDQQSQLTSMIGIVKQGRQVILSKPELFYILIGVFFIGFSLFSIETYWQSAFINKVPMKNSTWLLGIITSAGYFATILGNTFVQKLLNRFKKSWWTIYNSCRFLMAASLLLFALQKTTPRFIAGYIAVYLFLGASNVAESALINKYTPGNMRASMLSLNSLTAQTGGLCVSLFSSITVMRLQSSGIWLVAGLLLSGYSIFLFVTTSIRKTEKQGYPLQ